MEIGAPALGRQVIKQKPVKMGQKGMKTSECFNLIGH